MGILNLFKKQNDKDNTKLIFQAIDILQNYDEFDKDEDILARIEALTKDSILAWELYCFIPIIYGRFLFPEIHSSNEAIILMPDNSKKSILLSSIKTYKLVEATVVERIKLKDSSDKTKKVLILGAEIKAINDALNDGSKLSDLMTGPLVLIAPENYNPNR